MSSHLFKSDSNFSVINLFIALAHFSSELLKSLSDEFIGALSVRKLANLILNIVI